MLNNIISKYRYYSAALANIAEYFFIFTALILYYETFLFIL